MSKTEKEMFKGLRLQRVETLIVAIMYTQWLLCIRDGTDWIVDHYVVVARLKMAALQKQCEEGKITWAACVVEVERKVPFREMHGAAWFEAE